MRPSEYLSIRRSQTQIIRRAEAIIDEMREKAESCPFPRNVRPATPADIVIDQILWYKYSPKEAEFYGRSHWWAIVSEVINPELKWKSYVAEDGCRYGRDGAFVEVEEPDHEQ